MQNGDNGDTAANDAEAAAAADPGASAGHEAATGQPADDYPDLSKEAPPAEPQPDSAAAEGAEDTSDDPQFYPKRPFSMVWHEGLKAYTQDGNIFDRGTKKFIQKL
jgi:hypothetical protein